MRNQFSNAALSVALGALCATAAFAQAPGPMRGPGGFGGPGGPGGLGAAPAAGSSAVANPTYTSILMQVDVNRPAAEVWKRVGKFCDIGEWMGFPCQIISGKDGEIGVVRNIGHEVMVGKTDLSYTYTQPVTAGQPYILYHGTLEAKPVTATTSKLIYTLMWDNSTCADDAARERDKSQRLQTFTAALNNMKILAEGGTQIGRTGGPGGCAPPRGPGGPGGPGGGPPGGFGGGGAGPGAPGGGPPK